MLALEFLLVMFCVCTVRLTNEPSHEKTKNLGFRHGSTKIFRYPEPGLARLATSSYVETFKILC